VLTTTHPWTASSALTDLRAMRAMLCPGDPRAVFLDVYAAVTREVVDRLASGKHRFCRPEWASTLTGQFATLAIIADGPIWDLATDPGRALAPYKYALLGMNAHINYDLARAVLPWLDHDPTGVDDYRHDYFEVMTVLIAVMGSCLDLLRSTYRCPMTTALLAIPGGRAHVQRSVAYLVASWRAHVWGHIVALHRISDPVDRRTMFGRLEGRAWDIGVCISR
jgi:hypothetical protein